MRSIMTSKCNSPMPEIIVSPVSGSPATRKVGSSSESFRRATPIFSWSAFVLGSTRTDMTGSGKVMDSRIIGWSSSESVSPVVELFKPTSPPMPPGNTSLTSSRWLACRRRILPMRSFTPLFGFRTYVPLFKVPEYRRKNASEPTYGSDAILKTSAATGSSSAGRRVSSSWVAGSSPLTGGRSEGAGR